MKDLKKDSQDIMLPCKENNSEKLLVVLLKIKTKIKIMLEILRYLKKLLKNLEYLPDHHHKTNIYWLLDWKNSVTLLLWPVMEVMMPQLLKKLILVLLWVLQVSKWLNKPLVSFYLMITLEVLLLLPNMEEISLIVSENSFNSNLLSMS